MNIPETYYILKRKNKYLSDRFKWVSIPHTFPEWHFRQIFPLTMQYRDRPLEVGEMKDGTLENAAWTKL